MEVDFRKEYNLHNEEAEQKISLENTPEKPLDLFEVWYQDAVKGSYDKEKSHEVCEPYSMILSTVSFDNRPKSRVVLMREFTDEGLVFYTNYLSAKGKEMELHPYVAGNFFWPSIDRQVRVEGKVKKISYEKSKKYFDSRPLISRIGAVVSKQSEILNSRKDFITEVTKYHGEPICPQHWGGYLLEPDYFEFWLGRKSRLHERIEYRFKKKTDSTNQFFWEKFLLYP